MSKAKDRWDRNADRGVDGVARVSTKQGEAQVGAVEDSPGGVLLVWRGPKRGRAPLRIVDPLQGDPAVTVADMFASVREEGR